MRGYLLRQHSWGCLTFENTTLMKRFWTFDKVLEAFNQVKGMSRREAKASGLEKQWWAVYRFNKKLLIKNEENIYTLAEIMSNADVRNYIVSVINSYIEKENQQ
jgi:hypothetical protein